MSQVYARASYRGSEAGGVSCLRLLRPEVRGGWSQGRESSGQVARASRKGWCPWCDVGPGNGLQTRLISQLQWMLITRETCWRHTFDPPNLYLSLSVCGRERSTKVLEISLDLSGGREECFVLLCSELLSHSTLNHLSLRKPWFSRKELGYKNLNF